MAFRKVHKPLKRKGQRNKGAEGQREGTYIALCPLDPLILCPWALCSPLHTASLR
jgi:hypothetical protein